MSVLDKRELRIIDARFGLNCGEPKMAGFCPMAWLRVIAYHLDYD
jgi:hypothetical protein